MSTGQAAETDRASVRLAELMAAWTVAIDLALGAPLESGLRICLLASRLAQRVGADPDELRRTYDLSLLRHIGCTAGQPELAAVVGDERAFAAGAVGVDLTSNRAMTSYLMRAVVGSRPLARRPAALLRVLTRAGELTASRLAICEVARMLADRLDLGPRLLDDLDLIYERHDGKGFPDRRQAEAISLPAQLVQMAEAAIEQVDLGGRDAAVATLRDRRGRALRPDLTDIFLAGADALLDEPEGGLWDDVIAAEPGGPRMLLGEALDDALRALADFVDLKSRYTPGHSTQVAMLAADAARAAGQPERDVTRVRRAGWLHDVGRLAVSVAVWDKPAPLTRDEWEQVRLHAYFTERVFSQAAPLAGLARLSAAHHERLDGSGYHRGMQGPALPTAARILASADVYAALVSARPHRPALSPEDAAQSLREQCRAGRLDPAAVEAVLHAAGHRTGRRRVNVAGLTERELQVLDLLARGGSTRQIAAELVLSPRTVGHHIESIYAKANVKTRAGATMFAMQHGLVENP